MAFQDYNQALRMLFATRLIIVFRYLWGPNQGSLFCFYSFKIKYFTGSYWYFLFKFRTIRHFSTFSMLFLWVSLLSSTLRILVLKVTKDKVRIPIITALLIPCYTRDDLRVTILLFFCSCTIPTLSECILIAFHTVCIWALILLFYMILQVTTCSMFLINSKINISLVTVVL